MKLKLLLASLCLLTAAHAQNPSFPPDDVLRSIRPEGIRAQMAFLADDLLEGRGTGTRGFDLAALYIKAQFEEMGLKPAGDNDTYFQRIKFRQIELDRDQSSVVLKQNGKEQKLAFDTDFAMRGDPLRTDTSVETPMVFVGYGVTAPDQHYDDYEGVDVRGKIVLVLYGAPPSFPSSMGAHYSSATVKLQTAVAHGAVGYVSIWDGRVAKRIPFSQYAGFFRPAAMRWLDSNGLPNDAQPQIKGTASLSPPTAQSMFAAAGKSWPEIVANLEAGKHQSMPLAVTATLHVVSRHSTIESANIAGVLPGSDPKLKNEYVMFTAHADHLGIGDSWNGDSIYNGAGDDASGVAGILEIARAFSLMPTRPRRSILFLTVTAEEEGLLGSDYYAHFPTIPLSQVAANVNIDGIAFLYDFRDIVPLGAEHSSLGAIVQDVAQHLGVETTPDPAPEEVFFVRSDQYSFVKKGVPGVFISEGYKTVDPKLDGRKLSDQWEATRYHKPSDDMKQPMDMNAAVKSTRINLAVGYEVAQQTERPRWNAGDFFETYAKGAGQ